MNAPQSNDLDLVGGSLPAYPFAMPSGQIEPGLTKRELFAAMAMQGMVAHFGTCGEHDTQESAKRAVMCADALLSALERAP